MRWSEIEPPRLYLCTASPEKVGATVELESGTYGGEDQIEKHLEASRPEEQCSRARSIPLLTQPNGSPFIYEVLPIGLGRYHCGWLKLMAETDPTHQGVMAHCATNYWAGIECPEARREPWEYRAASIKILKKIGKRAAP